VTVWTIKLEKDVPSNGVILKAEIPTSAIEYFPQPGCIQLTKTHFLSLPKLFGDGHLATGLTQCTQTKEGKADTDCWVVLQYASEEALLPSCLSVFASRDLSAGQELNVDMSNWTPSLECAHMPSGSDKKTLSGGPDRCPFFVIEIRKGELALKASRPFRKGETVLSLPVRLEHLQSEPHMHTLQVGKDAHMDIREVLPGSELLNHSCGPSCFFKLEYEDSQKVANGEADVCGDTGGAAPVTLSKLEGEHDGVEGTPTGEERLPSCLELVALIDVPVGGNLEFDYNLTEWAMESPFECQCGSPMCVGTVSGFSRLPMKEQERRRDAAIVCKWFS